MLNKSPFYSKGYVISVKMHPTEENFTHTRDEVMYLGVGRSIAGISNRFSPFMTESDADQSKAVLKEYYADLSKLEKSWSYQVDKVLPITESMYKEAEDWLKRENALMNLIL